MNKKLIALIFGIVLLASALAIPWSPQGNVDMQKYWNFTNLSYFEAFTMKGNLTAVGYNISADNFIGNLSWNNLTEFPASCSAGYALTTLGSTVTCTRFVLATGDNITGTYNIDGNVNISYGTSTALLITGNIDMNDTATNHILLASNNDAITPTLSFGDGDSGIYEASDDIIKISIEGSVKWRFRSTLMGGEGAGYPAFLYEVGTSTNPNIVVNANDADTGIGSAGENMLSIIANSTEIARAYQDNVLATFIVGTTIQNNATAPSLAFGDGDSGFYESSDDTIQMAFDGVAKWAITKDYLGALSSGFPAFKYSAATATIPNILPNNDDTNTGIGWAGADILSLIAGGVQGIRINETGNIIEEIYLNGSTFVNGNFTVNNSDLFVNNGLVGINNLDPKTALDVNGSINLTSNINNRLFLPQNNTAATPTLSFGDGDSGIYEYSGGNTLGFSLSATQRFFMQGDGFFAFLNNASAMANEEATSTNPTLVPSRADIDTGIGWAGLGALSLIADSNEIMRFSVVGGTPQMNAYATINMSAKSIINVEDVLVNGDLNVAGNYFNNGNMGLTANYSVGSCWLAFSSGLMYSTNCTAL